MPEDQDRGAKGVPIRRFGLQLIAKSLPGILARPDRSVKMVLADLRWNWSDIAGPDWVDGCWPARLNQRQSNCQAVLHMNVVGLLTTQMHYDAPQFIERINRHLGFQAVDTIKVYRVEKLKRV